MQRVAATVGVVAVVAWPSALVMAAVDTSQCWKVTPEPAADGWVNWVSPNGAKYGIPAGWSTEDAYREIAAAGLCTFPEELPPEVEEFSSQPPAEDPEPDAGLSLLEQRAAEARATSAEQVSGVASTNEATVADTETSIILGGGVVFGLWALFTSHKENAADELPLSMRHTAPVPPPTNGSENYIIGWDGQLVSTQVSQPEISPGALSGVTEPSPWLADQIPPMQPTYPHSMRGYIPPEPAPNTHQHTPAQTPTEPPAHQGADDCAEENEPPNRDALKAVFERDAPYNIYDDDTFVKAVLRMAILAGLNKGEAVEHFYFIGEGGEQTFLTRGSNKAYQRFKTLFDEVKHTA